MTEVEVGPICRATWTPSIGTFFSFCSRSDGVARTPRPSPSRQGGGGGRAIQGIGPTIFSGRRVDQGTGGVIQVITHSQCPRNNSALGPKARPPATKEGGRKRRGILTSLTRAPCSFASTPSLVRPQLLVAETTSYCLSERDCKLHPPLCIYRAYHAD